MLRKPRFLNQLEKRRLRRLGILTEKQKPPAKRIPPQQEIKEELRKILKEGHFKIPKPSTEDLIK